MPDKEAQAAVLRRIRRVSGQVQGLARMVQDGRYCIDILIQVRAAEAALHGLGEVILRNHLETCVVRSFDSRNAKERQAKIDELISVFAGMRPK